VKPVRLIVYSDYLCPWCYNLAVRMGRLREDLGAKVRVEWRSFLLRPEPEPNRDLDRFRQYTQSWLRPGAEPDSGTFRVWETNAGPPSHSVPPHLAAKAAGTLGEDAFGRIHKRLLYAYFAENRDITERETLSQIWNEAGLPPAEFARCDDRRLLEAVLREHREAVSCGATGVPAVRRGDQQIVLTGAYPVDLYRRWVIRALEERSPAPDEG
jgi:predicted DsbA family dithiol-disulfide isomerase